MSTCLRNDLEIIDIQLNGILEYFNRLREVEITLNNYIDDNVQGNIVHEKDIYPLVEDSLQNLSGNKSVYNSVYASEPFINDEVLDRFKKNLRKPTDITKVDLRSKVFTAAKDVLYLNYKSNKNEFYSIYKSLEILSNYINGKLYNSFTFNAHNPWSGGKAQKYIWSEFKDKSKYLNASSISLICNSDEVRVYLEWNGSYENYSMIDIKYHNDCINYLDDWYDETIERYENNKGKSFEMWINEKSDDDRSGVQYDLLSQHQKTKEDILNIKKLLTEGMYLRIGIIYEMPTKIDDLKNIFEKIHEDIKVIKIIYDYIPNSPRRLNTIFCGPPGTGKTYLALTEANKLLNKSYENKLDSEIGLEKKKNIKFITFHENYSYEEFLEGYKYNKNKGKISIEDGLFKKICYEALWQSIEKEQLGEEFVQTFKQINYKNDKYLERLADIDNYDEDQQNEDSNSIYQDKKSFVIKLINNSEDRKIFNFDKNSFVLIIDEINRANMSKVLGDTISLIDEDKRYSRGNELKLNLPYSYDTFTIPPNIHIIGTMNNEDKSISHIDMALRRRFYFKKTTVDEFLINERFQNHNASFVHEDNSKLIKQFLNFFSTINKRLEILFGEDFQFGHSYLLNLQNNNDLLQMWNKKIAPMISELSNNNIDLLMKVFDMKLEKKEQKITSKFIKKYENDNLFHNEWYKKEHENKCMIKTFKDFSEFYEALKEFCDKNEVIYY